ncbi:hypothetical protein EV360DRAFT_69077 [Lentinula raphanica]|nr:hypothetical protein EV360DRAFT_69077 [Lentinula raphanica]
MNRYTTKDCEDDTDWVDIVERDPGEKKKEASIYERQQEWLDLQKFQIERLEKIIDRKNEQIQQLKANNQKSKAKRDAYIEHLKNENVDLKMKQLRINMEKSMPGNSSGRAPEK